MDTARTIKLDVISDFLCPWCYIGHVELKEAIAKAHKANLAASFEIKYHPYILNPSLPSDKGVDRDEYCVSKFGQEKWDAVRKLVVERATKNGINISMKGVMRNTMLAHRIVQKAWKTGGQPSQLALLEALFKAYYEEGEDIGDISTLANHAESAGIMSKDEAVKFLESKELEEEVLKGTAEVQKKGITGVPFTVIDHKWAVSGGQQPECYFKIFEKLASTESVPLTPRPIATTV